ncbi:MAG: hypothetical protein HGA80_03210 [Candidatus Omnitrophica bacterium]|nr:hypothetical protein [Candidatus Omnitrophota bacterium]
MSLEKARAHYLGQPGYQRFNCAQSIVGAFADRVLAGTDEVGDLSHCGGGRAPEGVCGALHAARVLLSGSDPRSIKECEDELLRHAGSLNCREIRSARQLSCLGCVEKVAESLERSLKGKKE